MTMNFTQEQGEKYSLAKGLLDSQIGLLTSRIYSDEDDQKKAQLRALQMQIVEERDDLRPQNEAAVDAVIAVAKERRIELLAV